jgi:hypothetical protein
MKVKLADIIREAADIALNPEGKNDSRYDSTYSCDTIYYYFKQKEKVSHLWLSPKQLEVKKQFHSLVKSMGCDTHSMKAFEEFTEGTERQSIRYAWLEMVALVAEDENIEVEIED